MTTPTLPPGYTPMLAAGVVAVRTPNGSLVGDAAAAWAHSLTPTLMTAAEMRAHLIERRRELEAQRALMEAEHAAQSVRACAETALREAALGAQSPCDCTQY